MRNPERIKETLSIINSIWHKYPDVRFNQLLYWLQGEWWDKNRSGRVMSELDEEGLYEVGWDLFNVEDDVFIEHLKMILEQEKNNVKMV